jgi:hypothetical protein
MKETNSMNYLSETPLNGCKWQAGGFGCKIDFENLYEELLKKEVMVPGQVFSQVNVCEDGLVFYFTNKG